MVPAVRWVSLNSLWEMAIFMWAEKVSSWKAGAAAVLADERITPGSRHPQAGPHFTEATAQPLGDMAQGSSFCWKKVTYLQSPFAAFRFLTFKKEILNWRGDRRGAFDAAWFKLVLKVGPWKLVRNTCFRTHPPAEWAPQGCSWDLLSPEHSCPSHTNPFSEQA